MTGIKVGLRAHYDLNHRSELFMPTTSAGPVPGGQTISLVRMYTLLNLDQAKFCLEMMENHNMPLTGPTFDNFVAPVLEHLIRAVANDTTDRT